MPHVPDRWLQGQLVIYHHPLDSTLESKRLKNWTLVKGSFSSAKVPAPPLGLVGQPDPSSLSFGDTTIFEGFAETGRHIQFAGQAGGTSVVALAMDSTRAMIFWYADDGGSPDSGGDDPSHIGAAAIVTATNKTSFAITGINRLALHEVTRVRTAYISPSLLESGPTARVVVAFPFLNLDGGGGSISNGRIKVISATGDSLTAGGHTIFTGGNPTDVACEALDSQTFLLAWREASNGASFIRAGTASGFSISLGSSSNFETNMRGNAKLVRLTSTKALLVYVVTSGLGTGTAYARVIEVSGSTVSIGPRFSFDTTDDIGAAALSSTKVVIIQRTSGGARIATISGSAVTFGPKFSHSFAVQGGGSQQISISPIGSSQFAAMYGAGGGATTVIGTVAGTSITFGPETTAYGPAVAYSAGCVIGVPGASPDVTSASHILMVLSTAPSDNDDRGRATLSSINYDGELTRTGGGYTSTIGSTKLAYTGWMNRPSD